MRLGFGEMESHRSLLVCSSFLSSFTMHPLSPPPQPYPPTPCPCMSSTATRSTSGVTQSVSLVFDTKPSSLASENRLLYSSGSHSLSQDSDALFLQLSPGLHWATRDSKQASWGGRDNNTLAPTMCQVSFVKTL